MKDYLIRGIDKTGDIRIFVATTTNMVEEARNNHNTSPTATAALGRALTAGSMMGVMMKNEKDRLTLKISGDGPIGTIMIVANNKVEIKGYVDHPYADVPSRDDGKLDVGRLVGSNGTITTIMDLGLKEPYIGQANLVSGEIAEDLATYYVISEQQPSAIGLGVLVDKDISVKAAGGYIIQLLPDVSDEDITKIEEAISKTPPISSLIDKGLTPEDIMYELLREFEMEILDRVDINYKCDCSRERIEEVLLSIGKKEIEAMIEEDGEGEVVCHFCNTKYHFSKEELEKLIVDK
ncbi:Hsp33 family molecular chaperone HslO [Tissierella carlieri]|uniref:Hsp33 family molecular chaperone HslO n=1 Tax=Tissierella carlieri TaxID=689904 RepID=UPI001C105E23|nr:Hsp33 family molecular chaperone HslO [Tissierella carlieri]MBU5313434.1 Hsp33 family molecular chaperone HslO [Tissierella carlieri]